jgi:hypothetical protein
MKTLFLSLLIICIGFADLLANPLVGVWNKLKGPSMVASYTYIDGTNFTLSIDTGGVLSGTYAIDTYMIPHQIRWYTEDKQVNTAIWALANGILKIQGNNGDTTGFPVSFTDPTYYYKQNDNLIGHWNKVRGSSMVASYFFGDGMNFTLSIDSGGTMTGIYITDTNSVPHRMRWFVGGKQVNTAIWARMNDTIEVQGNSGDTTGFPSSFFDPTYYFKQKENFIGHWNKISGPSTVSSYTFINNVNFTLSRDTAGIMSGTYTVDTNVIHHRIRWYVAGKQVNTGIWMLMNDILEVQGNNGDTTSFPISFTDPSYYRYDLYYFEPLTDIKSRFQNLPISFLLSQNYPNPFNPSTEINYQIPQQSFVSLKIFDLLGCEVAVLVNEKKDAGQYTVQWDASARASGVYFYSLQVGDRGLVKRMLLIK